MVASANRGNLSVRIDLNGLNGFQKEMGQGLNLLVATIGAGVSDVVRVMGALSDGDLSKTITQPYEGSFNELKTYTNNTVGKLSQVISHAAKRGGVGTTGGHVGRHVRTDRTVVQSHAFL